MDCIFLDCHKVIDTVSKLVSEVGYLNGLTAVLLRRNEEHTGVAFSSWVGIWSGVPLGSVPEQAELYLIMPAVDAKIIKEAQSNRECKILQSYTKCSSGQKSD